MGTHSQDHQISDKFLERIAKDAKSWKARQQERHEEDHPRAPVSLKPTGSLPARSKYLVGFLITLLLVVTVTGFIFLSYILTRQPLKNAAETELAELKVKYQDEQSSWEDKVNKLNQEITVLKTKPKGHLICQIHFHAVIEEFIERKQFEMAVLYGLGRVRYITLASGPNPLRVYRSWKNKKRWPDMTKILDNNKGFYIGITSTGTAPVEMSHYQNSMKEFKDYVSNHPIEFLDNDKQRISSLSINSTWINWNQPIQTSTGIMVPIKVPDKSTIGLLTNSSDVFIKFPDALELEDVQL